MSIIGKFLEADGLINKVQDYKKIYIYGAGEVGKEVYIYLKEYGLQDKISAFLVTVCAGEAEKIEDIRIRGIRETNISEEDVVIIAAAERHRRGMVQTCQDMQIKNIYEVAVFNSKEYAYYHALSEEEYPNELKEWYKDRTGEELNLENPQTFNEKINWMKLYDRDPRKTVLADKYLVRNYVKEKIGEEYLIPLLGVWNSFDDIDFDVLPNQFVLKCNHGFACNLIVKDKCKLNIEETRQKFAKWMNTNYAFECGFELQYKDIEPKIIAEEYISPDGKSDLPDYKFFCFNGEVKFLWTVIDRYADYKRILFTPEWERLPYSVHEVAPANCIVPKPEGLDEMLCIAKKLSEGFKHVRVDLYFNAGKIYFGEMTFTSESGTAEFIPKEFGKMVGDMLVL